VNIATGGEMPVVLSPCAEHEVNIPTGGIVLLVEGTPEPIVRESGHSFVLGRYGQGATTSSLFIDLIAYGAAELGVSRNHARVSYVDDLFVVEDLDSTNGSWLNDLQLTPGRNYPLQNNDRLTLGKLVMWVCLGKRPSTRRTTFSLEKELPAAAEAEYRLSLAVLQTEVLPYLEALSLMQQVLDELGKRPFSPPTIESINAAPNRAFAIQIGGLAEAVHSVADRLKPWRNLHRDVIGTKPTAVDPIVYQSLVRLAAAILADHNPALSTSEKFDAVEKLSPHLLFLALSPLSLTI